MSRRSRRNHGPIFKAKVALAAIKGEKTIAAWKAQLLEGAPGVFDGGSPAQPSAPGTDLKTLHAKIGELTLENDFLSAALGKAGLPSAKR